jgi:hypothetical protein
MYNQYQEFSVLANFIIDQYYYCYVHEKCIGAYALRSSAERVRCVRRLPVDSVQLKIKNLAGDFVWVSPRRSQNNQWVWPGDVVQKRWSDSDYPMPIRITSVTGETIEDAITGPGVSRRPSITLYLTRFAVT